MAPTSQASGWLPTDMLDKLIHRVAAWRLRQPEPTPILATGTAPTSRWAALPGNIIALADTGFEIHLQLRGPLLYTLADPEGRVLAGCNDLPAIKAYGERLAAERAEFVFKGNLL